MPTPSSREEHESAIFNSTCPDEQPPRPDWAHYRLPTYQEIVRNLGADASGSRSGTVTGTATGIGTGADARGAAGGETGDAATTIDESHPPPNAEHVPSSPLTAALEAHPVSRMAPVRGRTTEDDEDTKQSDADDDMAEGSSVPTEPVGQVRDTPLSGASGNRSAGLRTGRREAERERWEPMGVNQALRRQFDAATLAGYTSQRAPAADTPRALSTMISVRAEDQHPFDEMSWVDDQSMYLGCDPTSYRIIPTTPSTYLRPGSRFEGTQQSERQRYDVQVEIKHVDLRESFLCGYLRIQGLTDDHPTLTTYFEGEIIGSKYGFNTKHASWGANDRIDMSHWAKFPAFRQFAKQAKKGNFMIKEHLQKENIFMRWKEHFLVPDHRVRTIHGASFEGFYYICFNQVEGVVHGIYFHSKSEKFQQLELKHVNNRGCMSAVEFR